MSKKNIMQTTTNAGSSLLDYLRNSEVLQTLRHAGLFGVKGSPNPWKAKMDEYARETLRRQLNRTFDLGKASQEGVDILLKKAQNIKKDTIWSGKPISEVAKELGIKERDLASKIFYHTGGVLSHLDPVYIAGGDAASRTRFLHNLWEGGLIGKGSSLQNAILPGKALGENVEKYKNVLLGREVVPGLREAGTDALRTAGAVAKPLLMGGAIFPAASVTRRVMYPSQYDEGVLRGSLRDVGWYAGMTTGAPLGVVGFNVGSQTGQRIGDAIGAALEGEVPKHRLVSEAALGALSN